MIKAIETRYKGYRFRSRLEARWAVFFDTLGLTWHYEAQGFDLGGQNYLPDFELRDARGNTIYAEVKGDPNGIASDRYECERYASFVNACGSELVLLGDIPSPRCDTAFHPIICADQETYLRRWAHFFTNEALFGRVKGDILSRLCGLHPLMTADACDPDLWLVETRIVPLPNFPIHPAKAYDAARAARFEHGESPL